MGLPRDFAIYASIVEPWHESLRDPSKSQAETLERLLSLYSKTRYGVDHSSDEVKGFEDFRARFPTIGYKEVSYYLEDVRKGDFRSFLPEPPQCWVMTRGSTGRQKTIPATKTHLDDILACGARALSNYIVKRGGLEITDGRILNLSMPSRVMSMEVEGNRQVYGYSSGTYSRLFPALGGAVLAPRQEEIDALGPGMGKTDWESRFKLVYEETKDEEISAAIGVAPVILSFIRYLKKRHNVFPRDLWKIHTVFCTSVRKIHFRYAPIFKKYLGASTVEIYSATEGVYAQQLDELPYIVPNYDRYLFEVEVGGRTRMLHELKRGEWGRLIVSSCMFPRYDIGDMIEAMGKNYFRVFGRAKTTHILEHRLYRLIFGWLI
ncbi:MAG: GH3 family domain-containing protein [Candidatus Bathyarchaeia archaeon]